MIDPFPAGPPPGPNRRAEVRDVLAWACLAVDGRDDKLLKEVFTPDVVYRVTREGVDLVPPILGRRRLREHSARMAERERGTRRHHLTGTWVLSGDDSTVLSRSYFILTTAVEGHVSMVTTGEYVDELLHAENRWRISERTIILDADFRDGGVR